MWSLREEVLAPLRAAFQRMDGWCPDGLLTALALNQVPLFLAATQSISSLFHGYVSICVMFSACWMHAQGFFVCVIAAIRIKPCRTRMMIFHFPFYVLDVVN